MSNATAPDFDPLALVDSFYGPGAFCGWVLTVVSIGITWASNLHPHEDDRISVDFIIALSFPCIAAGHFLHLLATMTDEVNLYQHSGYPNPNSTTTASAAVIQYVAAAEAPLRICQSFMPMYYCLYQAAASRRHTKRLGYTVLVGLFVYFVKLLIYVQSAGEGPPLFSRKSPALTWGLIEPFYLLTGADSWSAMRASSSPSVVPKDPTGQPGEHAENIRESDEGREGRNTQEGPKRKAQPEQALPVARRTWHSAEAVLIINVPFSLVYMSLPATPGNGFLDLTSSFGPVPRSPRSILEMDQFAAFASGGLMVLFSIREAIVSRRVAAPREPDVEEPNLEVEGEDTASQSRFMDGVATGLGRSDTDQLILQRRNGGQDRDDGDIASIPLEQLDY